MRHLEDIALLLKTLRESKVFHALVIESPPGWAKSTTVETILSEANELFESLGSYSTPLALYNALCKYPSKLLVIDDCAGLFNDSTAMAILKGASWASAGSSGSRRVAWNSTSERVSEPNFVFSGKIILLCNSLPRGGNTSSFLSRTLHYELGFSLEEWRTLLRQAANNPNYFPNSVLANNVAEFLIERGTKISTLGDISLRTLQLGYELASRAPGEWRSLLEKLLPPLDPATLVTQLALRDDSVESQCRAFNNATGLSERTFFYYRSRLRVDTANGKSVGHKP